MGKEGKKNNKVQNSDILLSYEGKQELEDNNFNSKTNNGRDSVKKSKKKKRKINLDNATKEDLSVHIKDKEIDVGITPDPTVPKIKKEKKEKHNKLNEQELCEESQNDNHANTFSEDHTATSKKKKKSKKKLDKEDEMEIDTSPVSTEENKDTKKNKDGSLNDEKGSKTQNVDVQQSKKKHGKKAKTGAPVFNDDEAQVTEEDIDRFIDELDEEDNKQYEDWVKLLDARLSKK